MSQSSDAKNQQKEDKKKKFCLNCMGKGFSWQQGDKIICMQCTSQGQKKSICNHCQNKGFNYQAGDKIKCIQCDIWDGKQEQKKQKRKSKSRSKSKSRNKSKSKSDSQKQQKQEGLLDKIKNKAKDKLSECLQKI